jgi:dipeptidyl aminopeptidase/acylaminoacyl peptidase
VDDRARPFVTPPELIHAGSYEDRYNSPGSPVLRADVNGFPRLLIGPGTTVLLDGAGATPEGDRPFIDRLSLTTRQKERLFQSAAPYFENVAAVLNDDGTLLLTTRESPTERPNYYLRDLTKPEGEQLTALTHYPHPTPQLRDVQGADPLSAQGRRGTDGDADAAAGYDAARDGPLPMLMWAYPQEFKSAGAASQTTGSPYRFNAVSYWGPAAFLAMGYAVLDNPRSRSSAAAMMSPTIPICRSWWRRPRRRWRRWCGAAWPTATASPSAAIRMARS